MTVQIVETFKGIEKLIFNSYINLCTMSKNNENNNYKVDIL